MKFQVAVTNIGEEPIKVVTFAEEVVVVPGQSIPVDRDFSVTTTEDKPKPKVASKAG